MAPIALIAPKFRGLPFHDPFLGHAVDCLQSCHEEASAKAHAPVASGGDLKLQDGRGHLVEAAESVRETPHPFG